MDVPVTVNTVWTGPDGFMATNTAQPVMGSTTTYTSTAIVTSFGRNQSGNYTCMATVSSLTTSQFLMDSSQTDIKHITTGRHYILLASCYALYVILFTYRCIPFFQRRDLAK